MNLKTKLFDIFHFCIIIFLIFSLDCLANSSHNLSPLIQEQLNPEVNKGNEYNISKDFTQRKTLFTTPPLVLTAKNDFGAKARFMRLKNKLTNEGEKQKLRKKLGIGSYRFSKSGNIFQSDALISGEEPYSFDENDQYIVLGYRNRIEVYTRDFHLLKTLEETLQNKTHRELKGIHSVVLNPHNPHVLLVTATGTDRIFEINLKTEKYKWRYIPFHHSEHQVNGFGLRLIDKIEDIPSNNNTRLLTAEEVNLFFIEPEKTNRKVIPEDEEWYYLVDLDKDISEMGLKKWMKTLSPNSAIYSSENNEIIITSNRKGQIIKINQETNASQIIEENLGKPHGINKYSKGYLVTDTLNGKVHLYGNAFQSKQTFDFSDLITPEKLQYREFEWLQNTREISNNLFATIDIRRSQVYLWNPVERTYTTHPFSEEIVLHDIFITTKETISSIQKFLLVSA